MPYQTGSRLPGERGSKTGHLEVINSPLVQSLVQNFESPEIDLDESKFLFETYKEIEKPLQLIFSADGSLQNITSDSSSFKELTFVKTALFSLNQQVLAKVDPESPHPLLLRDIMTDSALYHATVFPLRNVTTPNMNVYNSVRHIIFDSLKDEKLEGEVMETLKWLAYQKWDGIPKRSPAFQCPHCGEETEGLDYELEKDKCSHCGEEVLLSDMLGFHLDMTDDSAPNSVASTYMVIHEILLLFTGVRHFWEHKKFTTLSNCLFVKDGPLTLRSQYVKLVNPIRSFFEFAKNKGVDVHFIGQEKSGIFYDHLQIIAHKMPDSSFFIPDNDYIRKSIQRREAPNEYGYRTNYGNKVLVKTDDYHALVLNIPTGFYKNTSDKNDFIGFEKILGSLHTIRSFKHEGALMPIELAHGIASLSTYPSARILKIFSGI